MKFTGVFSSPDRPVRDQVEWKTVPAKILRPDGSPVLDLPAVEVPAHWSQNATNVIAQKYFRKAGVPARVTRTSRYETTGEHLPGWLHPSIPDDNIKFGGETSAHQVFHRLAGAWTYHGWKAGVFGRNFEADQSARAFYDEIYFMLAQQMAAPNSPQWFNTGLWWAYGIQGESAGLWAFHPDGRTFQLNDSYSRPQIHACFINSIKDNLVEPGGIYDLLTREARIFKFGGGAGSNFSTLRGAGEDLTGGGKSSGMMSFLEIFDRGAGSIKSGGTTRRAAKMVVVDMDHPEIEDFINWKLREEAKAAAMYVGSKMLQAGGTLLGQPMPQAMIDRKNVGMEIETFGIDGMEAEAIRTVGGQNANNSVRVTDDFLALVDAKSYWHLRARTSGEVFKTVQASDLWTSVCRAAWGCADPGVQFHDTINRWHTCKADGEITASNPCSEYMFLNDTACNLASLNLCAFLDQRPNEPRRYFNVEKFTHAVRLWTTVLDISVDMASFPAKEIAEGTYKYRTLGLGYANLGGLLMRFGLPYDSVAGRGVAASITALMHGITYKTSAELAGELGPFPCWEANKDSMAEVIKMHHDAAYKTVLSNDIGTTARLVWSEVIAGSHKGFRNAQTTLIAPTGTISLVMECGDFTGIEPEFSLKKVKELAGGGTMRFEVSSAVEEGLVALGYAAKERNQIMSYILEHGTVEGALAIRKNDVAVFDCAVAPKGFTRCLRPMAHVEMMAAVQPFLSGAISKTVNLPNSATITDVDEIYRAAHRLGLKSIAIYRDGSKLTQPVSAAAKVDPPPVTTPNEACSKVRLPPIPELSGMVRTVDFHVTGDPNIPFSEPASPTRLPSASLPRGVREYLPWRRTGYTQKVQVGNTAQSIFLTLNHYPDGRFGEIYFELAGQGSTLRGMADLVGIAISVGLQYGVPPDEYVKRFLNTKFEPAGFVEGHDHIKSVTSIGDLVAREIGINFLGMYELGQVQPGVSIDTNEEIVALDTRAVGIARGYTGETCLRCHNATIVRAGACMRCDTCGEQDGCA